MKRGSLWRKRDGTVVPGSTFADVAPYPTDARPSCRAFFYGVTVPFPFIHAGPMPTCHILAAMTARWKVLRFVLSSRKAENRSCFRVTMGSRFVLSSKNGRFPFVLSSRNRPAGFVLSSKNRGGRESGRRQALALHQACSAIVRQDHVTCPSLPWIAALRSP